MRWRLLLVAVALIAVIATGLTGTAEARKPMPAPSVAQVSATSVSIGWRSYVGAFGYRVYLNHSLVATTTSTGFTFTGLTCGTTYTFGVDPFTATRTSSGSVVSASTAACAAAVDRSAPSAPTGVVASSVGADSVSLSWNASQDNLAVVGYGLYRDGSRVLSTTGTSGSFAGLDCGTSYRFGVDAVDTAGNRSAVTSLAVTTAACLVNTSSFAAVADTYASEDTQSTVHGGYPYLRLQGVTPHRNAYLRFHPQGLSGTVTKAVLRLYATSASAVGVDVHALADDSWQESSLVWTNAPSFASAVNGSTQPPAAGGWVSVDVSGLVPGNGDVNFALTTADANSVYLASRETATAPQLEITTSGGSTDTQPPSVPGGLSVGGVASGGLQLSWSAAADNVGVVGYGVYLNGSRVASTGSTSYSYSGLACGTGYTLAVDAYDAAGNRSGQASLTASTAACAASGGGGGGGGGSLVSCTRTLSPADSLGAVLNSVASGSTICLGGGTYSGNFTLSASNVTLTAAPGTTPLICGYVAVNPSASYVSFSHLKFDGSCTTQNVLQVFDDHFTLRDSEIDGGHTGWGESCVFLGDEANNWYATNTLIDHNRIHDCGSSGYAHGVYDDWSKNATITNNYIYANSGFGIQLYTSADNTLFAHNVVDGNGYAGSPRSGLIFSGEAPSDVSDNNTVRDNIFSNNAGYAIDAWWGGPIGTGNTASHNCFAGNHNGRYGSTSGWSDQGSNIDADPLYTDPGSHNYTLKTGSPCAGMGPS